MRRMKFDTLQHVLTIMILPFFGFLIGLGILPGYLLFVEFQDWSFASGNTGLVHSMWICVGLGMGYIVGGLGLLTATGISGAIFALRGKEGRFPLKSMVTIRWGLALVFHRVSLLFLPILVPSLFSNFYYRLMGLNLGSGVIINTPRINDAPMITLGDGVVIGGDATINGHLVEMNELVLAPVIIEDGALIGGGSVIQPGTKIGKNAVVASRAVVPKWTEIPDGETWGGIPAKCIRRADGSRPD